MYVIVTIGQNNSLMWHSPHSTFMFVSWFVQQVALSAVLVNDAGRTANLQFSRTAKKFRGKGFFRQLLLTEIVEIVCQNFPRIVRMRSSSNDIDFWKLKADGTQIILRRVYLYFCFVNE